MPETSTELVITRLESKTVTRPCVECETDVETHRFPVASESICDECMIDSIDAYL